MSVMPNLSLLLKMRPNFSRFCWVNFFSYCVFREIFVIFVHFCRKGRLLLSENKESKPTNRRIHTRGKILFQNKNSTKKNTITHFIWRFLRQCTWENPRPAKPAKLEHKKHGPESKDEKQRGEQRGSAHILVMQRQHQIRARGQQINAREQNSSPRIVVKEDDEVEEGEQEVGHVEQSFGTFSGMAPVYVRRGKAALTAPPLQHAASHKWHTIYIYYGNVFLVFTLKFLKEKQNLRAEFKETALYFLFFFNCYSF